MPASDAYNRPLNSRKLFRALPAILLFALSGAAVAVTTEPSSTPWSSLNQVQMLLSEDRPEEAITLLNQSVDLNASGNRIGSLKAQLLLAQAKMQLGEFLNARELLRDVVEQTQSPALRTIAAEAMASLGNVYIALGDQTQAELALRRAIELSVTSAEKASAYNNLGNHYAVLANYRLALANYRAAHESGEKSQDGQLQAQALANMAQASTGLEDFPAAIKQIRRSLELVQQMAPTHGKVILLLNLGYQLMSPEFGLLEPQHKKRAEQLLKAAQQIAEEGDDKLRTAYALHYQALLLERSGRKADALRLTEQALLHAQSVGSNQAGNLLGQLSWQAGRLLASENESAKAISYYRDATAYFRPLRNVISIRYDRRENAYETTIKPLYDEYVSVLFSQVASEPPKKRSALLREIRDSLEEIKAAELTDYFEDSCVEDLKAKTRSIAEVSSSALIIYPVSLKDRIELLLHLPDGEIINLPVTMPRAELRASVNDWREYLESPTNQHRRQGAALYEALVSPYEEKLDDWGIETLVFVPDAELRLVPMAALWDARDRKFLVEKYPVAVTPGVSLTDPRRINTRKSRSLYAGISKAIFNFNALPAVRDELKGSQSVFNGKVLIDEDFTRDELTTDLKNPAINILHFATHGVFSKDARQSFILSYDGKLYIDDLAEKIGTFKFRDNPLDLLVLSACETARGDEKAALGLSGVAIKAGARSAVGTLWKVGDYAASLLIQKFYAALKKPGVSRAQALQQAQISLMQEREPQSNASYRYPAFWSPFILINSWL